MADAYEGRNVVTIQPAAGASGAAGSDTAEGSLKGGSKFLAWLKIRLSATGLDALTGFVTSLNGAVTNGTQTYSPSIPVTDASSKIATTSFVQLAIANALGVTGASQSLAATPIFVPAVNGHYTRPATTRPCLLLPGGPQPALTGTTAGGVDVMVDGLDGWLGR